MSHDDRPQEETNALFTAGTSSWIPLDELVALWAAFGREATTAAAARATSAAFAALAGEREALHAYNAVVEERPRATRRIQGVGCHQDSIEALSLAAVQWYTAACALEEHAAQCLQGEEATQQDLQTLIGHTLAQQLLEEQVAYYPPYQDVVEARAATCCQHEGGPCR